jgi:putative endonuclease
MVADGIVTIAPSMPDERQDLGTAGEQAAERFLRKKRYVIVARNYRCKAGEVDIVALDHGTVVFVEVKTRRQPGFGDPIEAVDTRKQRQVVRAARHFIAEHRLHDRNARFDVVGVWWEGEHVRCELVENAFEANS